MVAVAHVPPVTTRLVVVRSAPTSRVGPVPVPPAAESRRLAPSTYGRRRLAAAGVVAGVLLAVSMAVQALAGGAWEGGRAPAGGPTYVVQPGDTFWDIARTLRPEADPRPLVTRLVAAHGTSVLSVGERIALPAGT